MSITNLNITTDHRKDNNPAQLMGSAEVLRNLSVSEPADDIVPQLSSSLEREFDRDGSGMILGRVLCRIMYLHCLSPKNVLLLAQ